MPAIQNGDVHLSNRQSPAPFQQEVALLHKRQSPTTFQQEVALLHDRQSTTPFQQEVALLSNRQSPTTFQQEVALLHNRQSTTLIEQEVALLPNTQSTTPFQTGDLLLTTWKSKPIPKDTVTLSKYKESTVDYAVYMKYGDVYATKGLMAANQPLPFLITPTPADSGKLTGNRSILKTNEGYLVAFYRAAAGGSLFWFDPNGKNKTKIAEQPLIKLLEGENVVYGINADTVNSIVKIDKKKGVVPFKTLQSKPLAADIDEAGNIIIITEKSLLSVDKNGVSHTLIEKGFWNGYLFPRSLVVYQGKVYVGMRNGVLTYELATKNINWLMEK
jgi:hypothetical protein